MRSATYAQILERAVAFVFIGAVFGCIAGALAGCAGGILANIILYTYLLFHGGKQSSEAFTGGIIPMYLAPLIGALCGALIFPLIQTVLVARWQREEDAPGSSNSQKVKASDLADDLDFLAGFNGGIRGAFVGAWTGALSGAMAHALYLTAIHHLYDVSTLFSRTMDNGGFLWGLEFGLLVGLTAGALLSAFKPEHAWLSSPWSTAWRSMLRYARLHYQRFNRKMFKR